MPLIWKDFRNTILAGLLNDSAGAKYTSDRMLSYARWAMAEVSNHTAKCDSFEWTGDDHTRVFPMPEDMIGTPTKNALVSLVPTDGSKMDNLSPYERLPETTWNYNVTGNSRQKVYWAWPSNSITLGFIPTTSEKIVLSYFRIWDIPSDDNSIITISRWMEQPVSYFIAAYAMQADGANAANIRQWNRKLDSGTPEDNPVRTQSEWYIKQAHRLLQQTAPQDRDTFYRIDPRSSMR